MTRTYVVTGSAAGIGRATAEKLQADGHHVIGVDLKGADVNVDLSTVEGREDLVTRVSELSGGVVDGVLAIAGLVTDTPTTVAVNHFGAVATLEGLHPLLEKSEAPRAAVVASLAVLDEPNQELLELIESGDEAATLARATSLVSTVDTHGSSTLYITSKVSLARWVRTHATNADWAGAGIALNIVAPGPIRTAMTDTVLATEEGRAAVAAIAPAPFHGPLGEGAAVANLLAWLTGEENRYVTGQVIFVDGGSETVRRPYFI